MSGACGSDTTTVPNGSYTLLSEAFNSAGSTFSSGVRVTVHNSTGQSLQFSDAHPGSVNADQHLARATNEGVMLSVALCGLLRCSIHGHVDKCVDKDPRA